MTMPLLKVGRGSAGTTGSTLPLIARTLPVTISVNITPRKAYTGTPNSRVDSLTPRRLPVVRRIRNARLSQVLPTCSEGNAEVSADTPAVMLTATVSV